MRFPGISNSKRLGRERQLSPTQFSTHIHGFTTFNLPGPMAAPCGVKFPELTGEPHPVNLLDNGKTRLRQVYDNEAHSEKKSRAQFSPWAMVRRRPSSRSEVPSIGVPGQRSRNHSGDSRGHCFPQALWQCPDLVRKISPRALGVFPGAPGCGPRPFHAQKSGRLMNHLIHCSHKVANQHMLSYSLTGLTSSIYRQRTWFYGSAASRPRGGPRRPKASTRLASKVCVASRPWVEFDDAFSEASKLPVELLTGEDMTKSLSMKGFRESRAVQGPPEDPSRRIDAAIARHIPKG